MKKNLIKLNYIMLFIIMCSAFVTAAPAYNSYTITDNLEADSSLDTAIDSSDSPHAVYVRSASVYYKNEIGNEELIGTGNYPTIDTDSNNIPHVAYYDVGNIIYVNRIGGSWSTPSTVNSGDYPDIKIDSNNKVHIAFEKDSDGDGYDDVVYTNNIAGSFAALTKVMDSYYRNYYYTPSLEINSNGNYHITADHHDMSCGGTCDHTYYVRYSTNASGGFSSTSPDRSSDITSKSIILDSNEEVNVAYTSGGNIYHATVNPWTETLLEAGSKSTIDASGTDIAIGYVDGSGNVRYALDSGAGFSTSTIDSGSNPSINIGNFFYYYIKNDGVDNEIYVKTYQTLSSGDSDNDGLNDNTDNCPNSYNPSQRDSDSDGTGDVCDDCPNDATDSCGDSLIVKVITFFQQIIFGTNPYALDSDGDGDNDGIADVIDFLTGNSSFIKTTENLTFSVNGTNDPTNANGILNVTIIDNTANRTIVEMEYNFTNVTTLNLALINITLNPNAGQGGIIISGLNLSGTGITKTVYVQKVSSANSLCIKDEPDVVSLIVSGDCSNGVKLTCAGTSGAYTCYDNGTYYKISGLSHSAVVEYSYSASSPSSSGGSSNDDPIEEDALGCAEDWACNTWEDCTDGTQSRDCFDMNSCGTDELQPYLEQECAMPEEEPQNEPEVEPEPEAEPQDDEDEGLGDATGAFLGGRGTTLVGIGGLIVIIIALLVFTKFYGGMPWASAASRATNFQSKGNKAQSKGNHSSAEKHYNKAQKLTEK